jgi:hypothetical protein
MNAQFSPMVAHACSGAVPANKELSEQKVHIL